MVGGWTLATAAVVLGMALASEPTAMGTTRAGVASIAATPAAEVCGGAVRSGIEKRHGAG